MLMILIRSRLEGRELNLTNNYWFPEHSGNVSFWFPERYLFILFFWLARKVFLTEIESSFLVFRTLF